MNDKRFFAHSREIQDSKEYQTIKSHADGVAQLVCEFSNKWCEKDFAEAVSLLHDVGKYQPAFQERIRGEKVAVPHALCGAKEFSKYNLPDAAAYIIAGHHAGIPDRGTLKKRLEEETGNYEAYKEELNIPLMTKDIKPYKNAVSKKGETAWKEYAFWIRVMFSCLVDADFLDTEAFCSKEPKKRGIKTDFCTALRKLKDHLIELQNKSPAKDKLAQEILKARKELGDQILSHIQEDANVYYMNMPTGSGKTLSSMSFALERAIRTGKNRIIYVIPYTSIIDQNAKVFKNIFGNDFVLEHHCNFDYEVYEDESTREKMRRSTENWDSSIIVTTNVQFFESIYSNKTSKLRKLHNIADSIIVFDEIHMLPNGFFQPCLESIKILTMKYGCEAVFLTATMPDFNEWLEQFKCGGLRTCNLINDTSCFKAFERCKIENIGQVSEEVILEKALAAKSALVVVNKRKTAKKLYEKCPIKKYHLSTYMNHFDRDRVIDEVRKSLESGERFCLFSTSLIEAGVDLDFEMVFRELSGLDSLLQTSGRCNRNGERNPNECRTYSFEFEDYTIHGKNKKYSTREAFEYFDNVASADAISFYFNKLYEIEKEEMQKNDFLYAKPETEGLYTEYSKQARIFNTDRIFRSHEDKGVSHFNFAGYAKDFKLINEYNHTLLIIDKSNKKEIEDIFNELKYAASGRLVRRKLQKYTISIRHYEWEKLMEAGVIQTREGIECLANENYYNKETGICFEDISDYIF